MNIITKLLGIILILMLLASCKSKLDQNTMFNGRTSKNKKGVYDSFIDWKKGKFIFKIIKFVINEDKKNETLFFANHVLVGSKHENQIKKMTLINGEKIPKSILTEIQKLSEELTKDYIWKNNKLLMINNKRFMHGRNDFNINSNREILNIQSLKINF